MPLKPMPAWASGAYTLASLNAACQDCRNLYSEIIEGDGEPEVGFLKGTPGLTFKNGLPTAPLRGLLQAGSLLDGTGGRLFAVAGSKFYELDSGGMPINGIGGLDRGDVGNDGKPVIMFANGNQIGIISAGQFWCDNGAGPVQPMSTNLTGGANTYSITGTCTTNGTLVTADSPYQFNGIVPGDQIQIAGAVCHVAQLLGIGPSYTQLVTVESTGFPTSQSFYVYAAEPAPGQVALPTNLTVGELILINTVYYAVLYVVTPGVRVNLATDPGNQLNEAWDITVLSGTVTGDGTTTLSWASGDEFPLFGLVGATILINGFGGSGNVVTGVTDTKHLTTVGTHSNTTFNYGINPLINAGTGAFLDSFFIISPPNSKIINVSQPLDGTTWNPLDSATKESYPDNIGTLLADHQELLVLGETHSEVWQAPGADPTFPFQPNESLAMAIGTAAPFSACSLRDGPVWIGASLRGQPIAYFAQGFVPARISTHAIEQVWKTYSTIIDAIGFIYEMDGHEFWQVTFPSANAGAGATWVYDHTASVQMGKNLWHRVDSWDPDLAQWTRHRACCHAYVFGEHWVGDFAAPTDFGAGCVYVMDSAVYEDSGQLITCQRVLPHLVEGRLRQFFTKLQLHFETGGAALTTFAGTLSAAGGGTLTDSAAGFLNSMVGDRIDITGSFTGSFLITAYLSTSQVTVAPFSSISLGTFAGASGTAGAALTILLEWSDDGGNTFVGGGVNFTYTASTTKKLDRATFEQLGSATDRVFRLTITGNARKSLVNCFLDSFAGIS